MLQKKDALSRARLAFARMSRRKDKGHVGHPQRGGAHEQLEEDLEAHRPQLKAGDVAFLAAEESSQRIARAPRLGEQKMRKPRARAAHPEARGSGQAGPAASSHVSRGDGKVRATTDLLQQRWDDLGRMLEVTVHHAYRVAASGRDAGDDRGAEARLLLHRPFDDNPPRVRSGRSAQETASLAIVAVVH